jgi:hypothetical protein
MLLPELAVVVVDWDWVVEDDDRSVVRSLRVSLPLWPAWLPLLLELLLPELLLPELLLPELPLRSADPVDPLWLPAPEPLAVAECSVRLE